MGDSTELLRLHALEGWYRHQRSIYYGYRIRLASRTSLETGLPCIAYTNTANDKVVAYPTGRIYAYSRNRVERRLVKIRFEAPTLYGLRKMGEQACMEVVPDKRSDEGHKGLSYRRQSKEIHESMYDQRYEMG